MSLHRILAFAATGTSMSRRFARSRIALSTMAVVCLACGLVFAGVTASISGTVKDSTGAVLVGASVTATNIATGVVQTVYSNSEGAYTLPALPPGRYDLEVRQKGFKAFKDKNIALNVNDVLTVDAVLPVGDVAESVTVLADTLHAETISTQLGEVIQDREMTSVRSMAAATPICSPCSPVSAIRTPASAVAPPPSTFFKAAGSSCRKSLETRIPATCRSTGCGNLPMATF
jgi:hypothetical protein